MVLRVLDQPPRLPLRDGLEGDSQRLEASLVSGAAAPNLFATQDRVPAVAKSLKG